MAKISSSDGLPYKPQYIVSPQMRSFWQKLFHGVDLSDKEVSQLTDQFVKNVANQMNQVLQWAVKQQKERHQKEKQDSGG